MQYVYYFADPRWSFSIRGHQHLLVISDVSESDRGRYTCHATNKVGSTKANIQVMGEDNGTAFNYIHPISRLLVTIYAQHLLLHFWYQIYICFNRFFFSKGVSSNAAHGPDGDFLLLEDPPYIAMEDVSSGVRGEQCNVFNTGS